MALRHYDILVPGHYFCDVIFTGIPGFPALGTELFTQNLTVVPGGVLNTVVALHRLGVKVGWLGALGNDFFSRFIADWIESEGLDISLIKRLDQPLRRVTVALSYTTDRAFVSYVDPAQRSLEMTLALLDDLDIGHLHFTGLILHDRVLELLVRCHERGITVSMDCQHREETLADSLVRAIISQIDLFMPNAVEAQRLTETTSLEDAAAVLLEYVPFLVVKDGSSGSHAWRNGSACHAPPLQLAPLDTTGAGDVFNAGFLAAYLAGNTIETCLHWGNIAGGLSTQGYGGCSTAPTRDELLAQLKDI